MLSKIDDLCSVVRHERTNQSSQLTLYGEFLVVGAPIVIEKTLYVNDFVRLPPPCLQRIFADFLDLHAHLAMISHFSFILILIILIPLRSAPFRSTPLHSQFPIPLFPRSPSRIALFGSAVLRDMTAFHTRNITDI